MKKFFTLIFSLALFMAGTQTLRAAATTVIKGTLSTGSYLFLNDEPTDAGMAFTLLHDFLHKLNMDVDYEKKVYVVSNLDNKVLFTFEPESSRVTLAPGITSDDDIIYTITDADRKMVREEFGEDDDTYNMITQIKAIELHFGTGGGNIVGTLSTGSYLFLNDEPTDAGMAFTLLNDYLHKLNMDVDYEKKVYVVSNLDNKVLFTFEPESSRVTLAPGITSDDDIIYTVTDADREMIREEFGEDDDIYTTMTLIKTIELHFDTSIVGIIQGTLGDQGMWSFENGVLTVDYVGAMPQNCTSKTTDPEIAYRLKWIDFLSEIKEIVITGVDVEVQPYFLYYSGDGDLGQHPDDHIKKLTLGSGVKKVGKQAFATYDLKDVYCYGIEPPELSSDTGNGNVFWKSRLQANQAFLHLVKGASTGYARINSEWAIFNHSAHALDPEDDPVDVKAIDNEQLTIDNEKAWYSLDGRKLAGKPTQKGIYIKDGKKFLVK